ncbi:hypothetical protein FNV43_RR13776 [Rhamnella rubrinervis]|uniref:Leucine-rich repeat-containing N-terminal plant-type domain-containing protein n=1 Tax=Rhamnella rubrinervis TaxID=2594499 RepID=A0A8K0H1N4_9ROSA|nr:hypothetical protein FNV43_RR13776 [Rhamnella rubrinervis]
MESYSFSYSTCILVLLLFLSPVYPKHHFSSLCHDDERSLLLQFKETLVIDRGASTGPSSYPKLPSWKVEGENSNKDCCSWYGVDCDEGTGHVIGLDLSSSYLVGFINSNSSLFRLVHLQRLNLANNNFNYSSIPAQLSCLSKLTYLNLSYSQFSGHVPIEISQLSMLSSLDLSRNMDQDFEEKSLRLKGSNFRSLIQNLTSIKELFLSNIHISSTVPEILANLSSLTSLKLEGCGLYGEFPTRIFHLPNLQHLNVNYNYNLTGHLPVFHSSNNLKYLEVCGTSFSGMLPSSLGNLTQLIELDLSSNYFIGHIHWSIGNLTKLTRLDLSYNNLEGPIPSSLYQLKDIESLFLQTNNLSGIVKLDMFSMVKSLCYLSLSNNSFSVDAKTSLNATFPQFVFLELAFCKLKEFPNFLKNQSQLFEQPERQASSVSRELQQFLVCIKTTTKQLLRNHSRYLAKWMQLEDDVLESEPIPRNNQIEDTFPFWLGTLPELKALLMSFNGFHGAVGDPQNKTTFSMLKIIDLSHNCFSGHLPSGYFRQLKAMKVFDNTHDFTYLNDKFEEGIWYENFFYSMTITNKGLDTDYVRIPNSLTLMDLSHNRFEGEIPKLIGDLNGLLLLNLSNNILTGRIPSSLGTLSHLEALDLSHNKLSGEIPPQLTQLNFLGSFSVSHNRLTGPIPHGKQFDTFESSSFEGNKGLCGKPLSKICGALQDSPPSPTSTVEEKGGFSLEFDWKPVVIGCGCGLVIGIVVGHIVIEKRPDWFAKTFGIRQLKQGW